MRAFHTAALSAVLLAAASAASAQPLGNFGGGYGYGSLGYTHLSSRDSGEDFSLSAITGRLGFMFNPFIGVEGEGSFGLGDDTVDFGSGSSGTIHIESDW